MSESPLELWGIWCEDEDRSKSRYAVHILTNLPMSFATRYEAESMIQLLVPRPTTLRCIPKIMNVADSHHVRFEQDMAKTLLWYHRFELEAA